MSDERRVMVRLRLVGALVVVSVLLVASCSLRLSSEAEKVHWSLRWLQGMPCRAPCFEGVTPGESTAQDALRIWGRSKVMRNVRLRPDIGGAKVRDVAWTWPSGEDGGSGEFRVEGDQQIQQIDFWLRGVVQLGDVIASYGDPTHIATYAACYPDRQGASYVLFVVFKRNSFALSSERKFGPESTWLMLDNDTTFDYVRFYAAGADVRVPQVYGYGGEPNVLVPWRGPQPLGAYLRDYTGGRCFVPTPTPQ